MLGGATARYADSISGTAGLLSARLGSSSPNAAIALNGGLSKFAGGEWVIQLSTYATALTTLTDGLRLGVAGGGGANRTEGSIWAGEASAGPIVALASGGLLATAGVALGSVRSINDSSFGSSTANARLRHLFRGGISISAGVTGVTADTTRYADLTADIAYESTSFSASLLVGFRSGDLADDPWAQLHLEYAVWPFATIEAGVGRYPRDLVGFTDGLFAVMGARFGLTPAARRHTAIVPPVDQEKLPDGRVRLSFQITQPAEQIEIAGDWNGWEPTRLSRDGSQTWRVELTLAPGIHRYALVVDGATWTVPEGVPTEPDDFGGKVALLVVR
jgi:hypothetical protein